MAIETDYYAKHTPILKILVQNNKVEEYSEILQLKTYQPLCIVKKWAYLEGKGKSQGICFT